MEFGAHLPLIDFDGTGIPALDAYVDAAREAGFSAISANDHLVFQRPWFDGIVALGSIAAGSAPLTLATTLALPVVRGPAALAKAAAALDLLSGGRFVLGVGPGSSARDYAAVGVPFDERWPRFDEAVRVLRAVLGDAPAPMPQRFYELPDLEPRPSKPIPIWIGSWGSAAGLRRVARWGDGWLASAYNTTPDRLAAARQDLHAALEESARRPDAFPTAVATMWTYVTEDASQAQTRLDALARMLDRDPDVLGRQVLIGGVDDCVARLSRDADAGVDVMFIWPLADPVTQLRLFGARVAPHLRGPAALDGGSRRAAVGEGSGTGSGGDLT
jgi:alkanesulfonate monooxygenase SsuD/methylene tetrahydromethanopterin reductase-like flavin-dependent oxidoreductase (luciferase family)